MEQIIYQGSDGCIRCLGDTHLVHYNHNHDKLGRFASSKGTARAYKKALNKMDTMEVKTFGREMKAVNKVNKTANKWLKKASKKGVDSKSAKRAQEKMNKSVTEMATLIKRDDEIRRHIDSVIKEATIKGYNVSSERVIKSSERGKSFANIAIGVSAGGVLGGAAAHITKGMAYDNDYAPKHKGQTPTRISANKYDVNKPKDPNQKYGTYTENNNTRDAKTLQSWEKWAQDYNTKSEKSRDLVSVKGRDERKKKKKK